MNDNDIVWSPFTPEQVANLNGFQHESYMHPFTCGNDQCRRTHRDPLTAVADGWVCGHCDYIQHWAFSFMASGAWRANAARMETWLRSGGQEGGK